MKLNYFLTKVRLIKDECDNFDKMIVDGEIGKEFIELWYSKMKIRIDKHIKDMDKELLGEPHHPKKIRYEGEDEDSGSYSGYEEK